MWSILLARPVPGPVCEQRRLAGRPLLDVNPAACSWVSSHSTLTHSQIIGSQGMELWMCLFLAASLLQGFPRPLP